jgi:hypothetical protein
LAQSLSDEGSEYTYETVSESTRKKSLGDTREMASGRDDYDPGTASTSSGSQGPTAADFAKFMEGAAAQQQLLANFMEEQARKQRIEEQAKIDGVILADLVEGRREVVVEKIARLAVMHPIALEVSDHAGMTLMHHAARKLDLEVLRALLATHGHLVNTYTHFNRSPGHWTPLQCVIELPATTGKYVEGIVMELLPQMNVDAILSKTSTDTSALHQAVQRGHASIVDMLCRHVWFHFNDRLKDLLQSTNAKGFSPLDLASTCFNGPIYQTLKSYGADHVKTGADWKKNEWIDYGKRGK